MTNGFISHKIPQDKTEIYRVNKFEIKYFIKKIKKKKELIDWDENKLLWSFKQNSTHPEGFHIFILKKVFLLSPLSPKKFFFFLGCKKFRTPFPLGPYHPIHHEKVSFYLSIKLQNTQKLTKKRMHIHPKLGS